MVELRVIGQRLPRPDAVPRVTGEALYTDDLTLPGMLHGAVVHAPHAHARVLGVDLARAAALPGVRAVLTPQNCRLLPVEVLYAGQKVAAVAAVDRHTARQAADLIQVEYEVLPAVFDPLLAMAPDAPEVRPSRLASPPPHLAGCRNICSYQRKERGDAEQALARAAVVVEETYRVGAAHQAYLEPHACVARFDRAGELTLWSSVQGQFNARAALAAALELPVSQVRVVAPEIGGAFGGKTALIMDPLAAELARRTGAPVKIVMTRQEELADSHPGPACVACVRTGAASDGALVAEWAQIVYDTGAAGGAPAGSFDRTRGLYRIPDFRYDIYSVYTHKLVPGAYRAPGALELTFAFEQQMDALARRLGLDPVELRRRNAVDEGDLTVDGKPYPAIGLRQSLRRAGAYAASLPRAAHRGVGVACGKWMNAIGASGVVLLLDEDGTVRVTTGAVDLTGVNTALAMVVAEELGIAPDQVQVRTRGTDAAPYAAISGGSRTTYGMSLAARAAAAQLVAAAVDFAAGVLGRPAAALSFDQGEVRVRDGAAALSLAELGALAIQSPRGPLTATGSASDPAWLADSHIFITQVAEVEVDPETGEIRVLRISSFQDVGRAINPLLVEGQIEGGIVQGMGWGLFEGLVFDRGVVLNDGLLEYRIPTAMDAPQLQPVLIEVPSPAGPYGLKGVGEPSMVATPAALANAIFDATGVRLVATPLAQSGALVR
ncbi:MAG: xanthine dehydrogenase family protein molybdopterin-binding subunit [Gemmatimonadota bacterium]